MNRRMSAVAGFLVALLAFVAIWALMGPSEDSRSDQVTVKPPRKKVEAPPRAKAVNIPLPRPADVDPPEPADVRPGPAVIGHEEKLAMNYAVDDVLKEARDSCIVDWIDGVPDPMDAEFVFDAVLMDGQLHDVSVRSLNLEMPQDVVDCIADAAWYGDWPTWDLGGELRLQRQITYRNAAALNQ